MKKIMISLLMVAAALNAMAVTYSGKVKVRLTSSDNQYCEAVVATSDDLNDGLNNSYYAPFNDENKDVHLYVEYNSVKYAHFGSSAATMQNMPLVMKANSATSYTLSFSAMVGTIEIYDTEADANIDKSQDYDFTIDAGEANTIIADRFIINYVPAPTPSAPQVTTNDKGWATFSYSEDLIPADGQTLYKGTINGEVLSLDEVHYVKAGEGVLVYGTPSTTYDFAVGNGSDDFSGNDLKATATYNTSMENVFVLKGDAFLKYVGTNALAANKAYIQLPVAGSNNAPQRIRMVINNTTAVENVAVESVEAEKFVENGEILIRRGNEVYNLQGQIVK